MLTGVRGAGGQQLTLTALGTRRTGAAEARSITGAGAAGPAGLGFAGIPIQALAAPGAAPARLTHTAEPARRIMADSVTAGLMGTGVGRGEAERGQGARWAEASKAIFSIHARASLATGVGRAFVDLHVAKGPCEARLADTVIAVDAISADTKGAGVAGTIIYVHLTVQTCGARGTAAEVFVHQVQALAPVAAGLAAALVHLALAARARVARGAGAGEAGDAINAAPVVARVWRAVVHVAFTQRALEALRAVALVAIGLIHALGAIAAWRAGTFVHIQLTRGPAEA